MGVCPLNSAETSLCIALLVNFSFLNVKTGLGGTSEFQGIINANQSCITGDACGLINISFGCSLSWEGASFCLQIGPSLLSRGDATASNWKGAFSVMTFTWLLLMRD